MKNKAISNIDLYYGSELKWKQIYLVRIIERCRQKEYEGSELVSQEYFYHF
ncbi:hypothetical protein HDC90_004216 [Pedobacter sp. AK013]|uniref:hypothetical protein n=1 Tax=Pedobacter sp. AK013 TaxID=2723071 RepID=UPI00162287CD|nr:hypothetical protein [Pedobacter sp. AK013]MBB6239563.1 hypothetical protein [Pedobacter sp. AK013]